MPPPNLAWPEARYFSPVRRCMRLETLLTRYLAEYLTHFHQTYISDALWDRDEHITFWCQRSRSWWNTIIALTTPLGRCMIKEALY